MTLQEILKLDNKELLIMLNKTQLDADRTDLGTPEHTQSRDWFMKIFAECKSRMDKGYKS